MPVMNETWPSTLAMPCRRPVAWATSGSRVDPLGQAGVDAAHQAAAGGDDDVTDERLVDRLLHRRRGRGHEDGDEADETDPIISTEALAAVRLGLRIALSRASSPVTRESAGSGAPRNLLSGREIVRRERTRRRTRAGPRTHQARPVAQGAEEAAEQSRETQEQESRRRCRPAAWSRSRCCRPDRAASRRSAAHRRPSSPGTTQPAQRRRPRPPCEMTTVLALNTTMPPGTGDADGGQQRLEPDRDAQAAERRRGWTR